MNNINQETDLYHLIGFLTEEEVCTLNEDQQYEIFWALKNEVPEEVVKLFAKPEFTWQQMTELRWGYELGAAPEVIVALASPEYSRETIAACVNKAINPINNPIIKTTKDVERFIEEFIHTHHNTTLPQSIISQAQEAASKQKETPQQLNRTSDLTNDHNR